MEPSKRCIDSVNSGGYNEGEGLLQPTNKILIGRLMVGRIAIAGG